MLENNIQTVSSADFVRKFAQVRQSLGEKILFITHHGRETHVFMSANAYRVMKEGSADTRVDRNGELPGFTEAAAWLGSGLLVLGGDKTIRFANDVAVAALGKSREELEGQHVYEAVPEFSQTLAQTYVDRAMVTFQPDTAEVPSLMREGNWVRLSIFPTTHYAAILFQDITQDVETNRLADAKRSIIDAMSAHGGIGYLRVNVREQISSADDATQELIGLEEGRLLGVRVTDLVPVPKRVQFREALYGVLDGDGPRRLESAFYCNSGEEVPVALSIVAMQGAYGNEGAVIVFTRL